MYVIEKYTRMVEYVDVHQKLLTAELAELSSKTNLTPAERQCMNDLMDAVGYNNITLSYLEKRLSGLKSDQESAEIQQSLKSILSGR